MPMSGKNSSVQPPVGRQDIERYEQGWTREMMTYWRERILKLQIYHTGALYKSLTGTLHPGSPTTIEHRFLYYGVYVASGVGNGYRRGNGGDLAFLQDWKTNRDKHRQKRDWFARKYFSSIMRLGEFEAAFYGQSFNGLMSEALQDVFDGKASLHFR